MNLQQVTEHPLVTRARAELHKRDRHTLDEQIRIVSIEAPTGLEAQRALYIQSRFVAIGLQVLEADAVGNVLARLPGGAATDHAPVILASHLDTIFPAGTDVTPQRQGDRVCAPGITDNARGLAGMLAIAAALCKHKVVTDRPIVFVATVGEEGLGDLRGVKHLFRSDSPYAGAHAFVSLDGAGTNRIVNRAIGACRLRAVIRGLGGHSWGDRGLSNPVHAMGLAVARLRELRPEGNPACSVNVGRLAGGTSVNAIPSEAWMEVDLRSHDRRALLDLEVGAVQILEQAVREEIAQSGRGVPLVLEVEKIGDRPCGETDPQHPLVVAAEAATRLVGSTPELTSSSTDANVPISMGIPAITIGAGGNAGGVHTTEEWYENTGGASGIERALLTLLAVAGVQ